jgi:hypothetical protein
MELVIRTNGSVLCLYDEAIDLNELGRLTISRGSHVEPNDQDQWHADLSPVGGPVLGPFPHRSDALAAEHDWLEANWLTAR